MYNFNTFLEEHDCFRTWRWQSIDNMAGNLRDLQIHLNSKNQLTLEKNFLRRIEATYPTFKRICNNAIFYRDTRWDCVITDIRCTLFGLKSTGRIESSEEAVQELTQRILHLYSRTRNSSGFNGFKGSMTATRKECRKSNS